MLLTLPLVGPGRVHTLEWPADGFTVFCVGFDAGSFVLSRFACAGIQLPLHISSAVLDMDTLLTLVFSAKESFYKGVVGLVRRVLAFDAIELQAIDVPAGRLMFEVREALGAGFRPGRRVEIMYGADASRVLTFFHRPM